MHIYIFIYIYNFIRYYNCTNEKFVLLVGEYFADQRPWNGQHAHGSRKHYNRIQRHRDGSPCCYQAVVDTRDVRTEQ